MVTDMDSAIERVQGVFDAEKALTTPEPPAEQAKAKPEPQPEPGSKPGEGDDEPSSQETTSDDEGSEPEAEAADALELPETLTDLAEALEMEPQDIADKLKVQIKVAGEVSEVTLSEAVNGYQRERDYTRQTQRLGDDRRALEAEQAKAQEALAAQRQELADMASLLQTRLSGDYSDERMERVLSEQGAEAYVALMVQRDRDRNALEAVRADRDKAMREQAERLTAFRAQQIDLLRQKIPAFADPDKGSALERKLSTYLQDTGFTSQEVAAYFNGPFDHRYVALLDKARMYDELQKAKKSVTKKVSAKPPLKKAGAAEDRGGDQKAEKTKTLRDRLKQASRKGTKAQQRSAAEALVAGMLEP